MKRTHLLREMQGIQRLLRSQKFGLLHRFRQPEVVRAFSTSPNSGSTDNNQSHESIDDFERRIFGDMNAGGGGGGGGGGSTTSDSFFQKLDRVEKAHDRSGLGSSKFNFGKRSDLLDGLDDSFTTLTDGMGRKLKKAAMFFDIDPEEVNKDDYAYRPDISFRPGSTYETKDLDLTKPGIRKPFKRQEFEVTTKEVLRKADFRNVRFLANFITESGIIIKRSKTGISAKAQRKVAREIKTARAFGLMPFTTMGTKHFVFGKTMEDLDEDYEYDTAYSFVDNGPVGS